MCCIILYSRKRRFMYLVEILIFYFFVVSYKLTIHDHFYINESKLWKIRFWVVGGINNTFILVEQVTSPMGVLKKIKWSNWTVLVTQVTDFSQFYFETMTIFSLKRRDAWKPTHRVIDKNNSLKKNYSSFASTKHLHVNDNTVKIPCFLFDKVVV